MEVSLLDNHETDLHISYVAFCAYVFAVFSCYLPYPRLFSRQQIFLYIVAFHETPHIL